MEKKINKQSQRAMLPMLELVISIGLFAIISIFLLQMFLAANSLQNESSDKSKAITYAQTVAGFVKSADTLEQAMEELGFSQISKNDGIQYEQYCDVNWKSCKEKDAAEFYVVLQCSESDVLGKTLGDYQVKVERLKSYPSIFEKKDVVELYTLSFASETVLQETEGVGE